MSRMTTVTSTSWRNSTRKSMTLPSSLVVEWVSALARPSTLERQDPSQALFEPGPGGGGTAGTDHRVVDIENLDRRPGGKLIAPWQELQGRRDLLRAKQDTDRVVAVEREGEGVSCQPCSRCHTPWPGLRRAGLPPGPLPYSDIVPPALKVSRPASDEIGSSVRQLRCVTTVRHTPRMVLAWAADDFDA